MFSFISSNVDSLQSLSQMAKAVNFIFKRLMQIQCCIFRRKFHRTEPPNGYQSCVCEWIAYVPVSAYEFDRKYESRSLVMFSLCVRRHTSWSIVPLTCLILTKHIFFILFFYLLRISVRCGACNFSCLRIVTCVLCTAAFDDADDDTT